MFPDPSYRRRIGKSDRKSDGDLPALKSALRGCSGKIEDHGEAGAAGTIAQLQVAAGEFGRRARNREAEAEALLLTGLAFELREWGDVAPLFRCHARSLIADLQPVAARHHGAADGHRF